MIGIIIYNGPEMRKLFGRLSIFTIKFFSQVSMLGEAPSSVFFKTLALSSLTLALQYSNLLPKYAPI
jgi:hypothetical protein